MENWNSYKTSCSENQQQLNEWLKQWDLDNLAEKVHVKKEPVEEDEDEERDLVVDESGDQTVSYFPDFNYRSIFLYSNMN